MSVFLFGKTSVDEKEIEKFLAEIGVPGWWTGATGGELLVGVAGRMCYDAFGTKLNENLRKTRADNADYLKNILAVGHGSILEHVTMNFMFTRVSRVFTHELVRHRLSAFSQQSLRFVKISGAVPFVRIEGMPDLDPYMEELGVLYEKMKAEFNWDVGMSEKKKQTSFCRRVLPMGIATNIMWSTNIRNLRHVITMRTEPVAEIEMQSNFAEVNHIFRETYPNFSSDCIEHDDGWMEYPKI